MTERDQSNFLLPVGVRDVLAPDATFEAETVEGLMAHFGDFGYDRVKPPLVEFETTLLSGFGSALSPQTFRLLDPASQRMMALRSDLTVPMARIAQSRLSEAPRPLRLSYGGEVLRVQGSNVRPERQFIQVGCELLGSLEASADAEVLLLAIGALRKLEVPGITVDLALPTLVPILLDEAGISGTVQKEILTAIDCRDASAVKLAGGKTGALIAELMLLSGDAPAVIESLTQLELPATARADIDRLSAVTAIIRAQEPRIALTIDLVEQRGFAYKTGLSFSLFAQGVTGELGRGGRYRAGGPDSAITEGEPAVGCTLYLETVLKALRTPPPRPRILIPADCPHAETAFLRDKGWVTVHGLTHQTDEKTAEAEAKRQGCQAIYSAGRVLRL